MAKIFAFSYSMVSSPNILVAQEERIFIKENENLPRLIPKNGVGKYGGRNLIHANICAIPDFGLSHNHIRT